MEAKLRFSDIVRYFFVGGFTCFIVVVLNDFIVCEEGIPTKLCDLIAMIANVDDAKNLTQLAVSFFSSGSVVTLILAFALMCFVGVIVQGFRMFVSYIPRWRRKESRYKMAKWTVLLFGPLYLDVYSFCYVLRKYKSASLPSWVYISDIPNKLLATLEDFVTQRTSENIDGDMKFFNDCFSALALVLYVATIVTVLSFPTHWNNVLIFFAAYVLCAGLAAMFAYRHINNIGSKCLACEKEGQTLGHLYDLYGSPVAFVLIRTTTKGGRDNRKKLTCALESIAMQTYKNIRILIPEDVDESSFELMTQSVVEEFVNKQIKETGIKDFASRVSLSRKKCGGPAGAAYYIRETFINIAKKNDVAIMLDDDDTLRREDSILDIINQICRFQADICLSSFETMEEVELNICNNGGKTHNDIVSYLSRKPSTVSTVKGYNICFASSIGWTKSYRYDVVKAYNESILNDTNTILYADGSSQKKISYSELYRDLSRYEDFPDFLTLLFKAKGKKKGYVLTGVEEPTHLYHKNPTSITGDVNIEDFMKSRPHFLALTLIICSSCKNSFVKHAFRYALTYVMFKELQICNIFAKYTLAALEGTQNNNYESFKEKSYKNFLSEVDNLLQINKLKIDKRDLDWAVERIKKYYKNIDVASIAKLIKQEQQNETPSTDSSDEILRSRVLDLLGLIMDKNEGRQGGGCYKEMCSKILSSQG